MNLNAAKNYIYEKLQKNLSSTLTYHGFHHTIDVVKSALEIAKNEKIVDEESLILLETATIYHDLGFITTYRGHEEESCRIAKLSLPKFDYSANQIEVICGMIMATKIPQKPHTILEKIIADADLDYLGRDDFQTISDSLFNELYEREMVTDKNMWNEIQVKFLESHHYWTQSVIKLRNAKKLKRLEEIKRMISDVSQ